jgi:hypothetical protein
MVKLERIRKSLRQRMDGGKGSGNWGHEGRPGEVGGSAEGGGNHNRMNDTSGGYTSWSKNRDKLAKQHKLDSEEMDYVKNTKGSILVTYNGERYMSNGDGFSFTNMSTGATTYHPATNCKVFIPNESNTNFVFTKAEKAVMGIRKSDLGKAYKPKDNMQAYEKYVGKSGEVYKSLDTDQKKALATYTGSGYKLMNSALRAKGGKAVQKKNIEAMTNAIDKSELEEDVVLGRGLGFGGLSNMFGVPEHVLRKHPEIMVGRIGTDQGFGSCGSCPGSSGFGHKPVQMEILAPKGTKALYAEPFSSCGSGYHSSWDGEKKQKYTSTENETLLQRGTSYQILECKEEGGKLRIKVAILDQQYSTEKYNKPAKTKSSKPKTAKGSTSTTKKPDTKPEKVEELGPGGDFEPASGKYYLPEAE